MNEKERPILSNDEKSAGVMRRSEELAVTVPISTLHTAFTQAEQTADAVWHQISELERQRDAYVRQAGGAQQRIDHLRAEHEATSRHLRNISGLL